MATRNLLIVEAPSELDLLFCLARKMPVIFSLTKEGGQGMEANVPTVLSGLHVLDETKKVYALSGKVEIPLLGSKLFDIKKNPFFIATVDYSDHRQGRISFSTKPGRMPWDTKFPCYVCYSADYFELLAASCLLRDYRDINCKSLFGGEDKQSKASRVEEVNFELVQPRQVLGKKKSDEYGLSWTAKGFRPATKLEHLMFAIRYPEESRFYDIVCRDSELYRLGCTAPYLYLHEEEDDRRWLKVTNAFGKCNREESDVRILAVQVI